MSVSHTFDLTATNEYEQLQQAVASRFEQAPQNTAATQPDFEMQVLGLAMGMARAILKADIQRHDEPARGVVKDGTSYRRKHRSKKKYLTRAGEIEVERWVFVERGGHGGSSLVPLELRLGLVGGHWTLKAAELACRYMEETTSAKGAELLAQHQGMAPSPSHLDRLPKTFNEVWEGNREALEIEVRKEEQLPEPEAVSTVVFSLDGVMVPMKTAPRTKTAEGPKGHKEASCGSVFLVDAEGNRLHTIKLGRMPEKKKVTLMAQLVSELTPLKQLYPKAKWQVVADGAHENWRLTTPLGLTVGVKIEQVLDFWHAAGHLSEALALIHGSNKGEHEKSLEEWKTTLKENCHGPGKLIRYLKGQVDGVRGQKRKDELTKKINYFERNRRRMGYAKLLRHNRPIGSGVVEAGCKTLVTTRMKRSGMSWETKGGQAILTLRSLHQSERMDSAWKAVAPYFRQEVEVDPNPKRKRPVYAAA